MGYKEVIKKIIKENYKTIIIILVCLLLDLLLKMLCLEPFPDNKYLYREKFRNAEKIYLIILYTLMILSSIIIFIIEEKNIRIKSMLSIQIVVFLVLEFYFAVFIYDEIIYPYVIYSYIFYLILTVLEEYKKLLINEAFYIYAIHTIVKNTLIGFLITLNFMLLICIILGRYEGVLWALALLWMEFLYLINIAGLLCGFAIGTIRAIKKE